MQVDHKLGKLFDMYDILGVVRVCINDLSTSGNLEIIRKSRNYKPNTVQVEIFARRKFSPISPPALIGEIFCLRIYCPVLMIT